VDVDHVVVHVDTATSVVVYVNELSRVKVSPAMKFEEVPVVVA
jgi:hypothetical protein